MIIDFKQGDVLESREINIAFAVNTQGINDAGFAGQVAGRYWPRLASLGEQEMGTVKKFTALDRIFYAIVVHSLDKDPGWASAPSVLQQALDKIYHEAIGGLAMPLPGAGMIGQMQGANVFANLGGIARSRTAVRVWSL